MEEKREEVDDNKYQNGFQSLKSKQYQRKYFILITNLRY